MWSDGWKVAVKKCSGYLLLCLWALNAAREHAEAVLRPFHLLPKWVWGLESHFIRSILPDTEPI